MLSKRLLVVRSAECLVTSAQSMYPKLNNARYEQCAVVTRSRLRMTTGNQSRVTKSTGTDWSIGCDERAKARVTIPDGGAMRKGRLGALHNSFG